MSKQKNRSLRDYPKLSLDPLMDSQFSNAMRRVRACSISRIGEIEMPNGEIVVYRTSSQREGGLYETTDLNVQGYKVTIRRFYHIILPRSKLKRIPEEDRKDIENILKKMGDEFYRIGDISFAQ